MVCGAMEYRKGSHSLYDIKLHVVWITKYRKPVLSGAVGSCAYVVVDSAAGECFEADAEA